MGLWVWVRRCLPGSGALELAHPWISRNIVVGSKMLVTTSTHLKERTWYRSFGTALLSRLPTFHGKLYRFPHFGGFLSRGPKTLPRPQDIYVGLVGDDAAGLS